MFFEVYSSGTITIARTHRPSMPSTPIQAFPMITFNTCFTNLQGKTIFLINIKTLKHAHTSRVKGPAIINLVSFNLIYTSA